MLSNTAAWPFPTGPNPAVQEQLDFIDDNSDENDGPSCVQVTSINGYGLAVAYKYCNDGTNMVHIYAVYSMPGDTTDYNTEDAEESFNNGSGFVVPLGHLTVPELEKTLIRMFMQ